MITKGQIEKATDEYIGYAREADEGLGTTMRRHAFMDGAQWRINSVWHDISEVPKKSRYIAVMFKSRNSGFTLWYVTDDIMQVFEAHRVTKWAYMDDLMPERKEESI